MQEKNFNIKNNILNFVYNNTDYSINLDQLEQVHLYKNCVVFISNGKVNLIPDYCFNINELTFKLLDNSNYMVCGKKHIINMQFVKSAYIESFKSSDQHEVILTFTNGRKEGILLNSWREAERLYHEIDDKLAEIKNNQASCN